MLTSFTLFQVIYQNAYELKCPRSRIIAGNKSRRFVEYTIPSIYDSSERENGALS